MWGGHVPGVWAFWGVLGSQGNNAIARALVGPIPAARALLSPWAYPCWQRTRRTPPRSSRGAALPASGRSSAPPRLRNGDGAAVRVAPAPRRRKDDPLSETLPQIQSFQIMGGTRANSCINWKQLHPSGSACVFTVDLSRVSYILA